ncbi:MAG: hypothetical protein GY869_28540, partial [Planctomycetes bacterium]|nr:hypothetical protein [Planctomycetota bacterium]
MTIDKFDNEWGEDGTRTPVPSATKIDTGWVSGAEADRPSIEYFNFLQYRADHKINQLVEHGALTAPPGLTQEQIASKRFGTVAGTGAPWAHMWSAGNEISVGATLEIIETAVAFDPDTDARMLLILEATNNRIYKYNTDTLAEIDNSASLLDTGLPSGGGEDWEPNSFCCDNTYIYVLFQNNTPTPNETHYVQSYLISDYSVNTGWAATGTALQNTGTSPDSGAAFNIHQVNDRIILADDDNVACLCS